VLVAVEEPVILAEGLETENLDASDLTQTSNVTSSCDLGFLRRAFGRRLFRGQGVGYISKVLMKELNALIPVFVGSIHLGHKGMAGVTPAKRHGRDSEPARHGEPLTGRG